MASFKVTSKTFNEFDFTQLKMGDVKLGKGGMRFANLSYKGMRIVIETPAMTVPWNTEIRRMDESSAPACKQTLSFQGMDSNEKVAGFHQFLEKFDQRVKELAFEHKLKLWPTKNIDENKIEGFYRSALKESSDPSKYSDTFQPKVKIDDGDGSGDMEKMKMLMSVYNTSQEVLSPSEITGGSIAAAIVDVSYLWSSSVYAGVAWTVKSVLVQPKKKEEGFMFGGDAMEDFQVEGSTSGECGSEVGSESSGDKRKRSDDEASDDLENEEQEFE